MIEFKSVSKSFGQKVVLDDVSFHIGDGEIVFVIGKSGMGKSVMLKNIVGLMRPDAGEIWVKGQEVSRLAEAEYFGIRKLCGMIFQSPALLDSLSVYENLAFGLRAHRIANSAEEIEPLIHRAIGMVNLPESCLERYPAELSFGMQKRISLARTLVLRPDYLLYDEPTTGLDPVATHAINHLIETLSRTLGVTSLVVSHDMECALEIADRILMLDHGKILASGSPTELLDSEVPMVQEFMREAKERRL